MKPSEQNKLNKKPHAYEISGNNSELSAHNGLNRIGSRQGSSESKSNMETFEPHNNKSKKKQEKTSEKRVLATTRDHKKHENLYGRVKRPSLTPVERKNERDYRRFKTKYNNSIGNIMRDWMSLIYCILILRMNLLKFVLNKLPNSDNNEINLHNQILLESKTVFDMVRSAQNFSQEQFLFMWVELNRLISSRMILNTAREMLQTKDTGCRDWSSAAARLAQLQEDFEKAQDAYKAVEQSKIETETALKENLTKLESVSKSKDAEYTDLLRQITDLKKKEVQMRGKILINMKNYKDLKLKKQSLINVENEIIKLKNDQNEVIKDYITKIQSLRMQIDEKEKQLQMEKEENKKIKANLEGLGDFSGKP